MLSISGDQTKSAYCVAVMHKLMNDNGICPGNHDVSYDHGWFQDGDKPPEQRPELTEQAEEYMKNPAFVVGYQSVWNAYVIMENPDYEYDEFA